MTPCWHMTSLLLAHSHQKLGGFLRRYLLVHLNQCAQCRAALEALLLLGERLRALRHTPAERNRLTPEREAELLRACAAAETRWKRE